MSRHRVSVVDPFELPGWVGEKEVRWITETSLDGGHHVSGRLEAEPADGLQTQPCDLLACDRAYPQPVLDEPSRAAAHQAWALGEVRLLEYDGRLTLVVPGSAVTSELSLEALRRLARAVGAPSQRFSVVLRL